MKLVFPAHSKKLFYFTEHISKYLLEQNVLPLNPFMIWHYFLLDSVPREKIYDANEELVKRCDELWVFGPVSDGVHAEIQVAKIDGKPIKYFAVEKSKTIEEISKDQVVFEEEEGFNPKREDL